MPDAALTDDRPIDDPARLADEARDQVRKYAEEIRATQVDVETEPPTVYRP